MKNNTIQTLINEKKYFEIRKYLNEKGVVIKSLIKILNIDKYLITLIVDGDEKVLNIEDAENIMVRKNTL